MSNNGLCEFVWEQQPVAAEVIDRLLSSFCADSQEIDQLGNRLREETGTRLLDWVDTFFLSDHELCTPEALKKAGFLVDPSNSSVRYHPGGIFPKVAFTTSIFGNQTLNSNVLGVKVDCAEEFSRVYADGRATCLGKPGSTLRVALLDAASGPQLAGIERHGHPNFSWPSCSDQQIAQASKHLRAFAQRTRVFENNPNSDAEAFELCGNLVDAAVSDLGADWACDLFFESERRYWQNRNHAARVQYARQQKLGLGWANHDHHTYRSSRAGFAPLVAMLEKLGLECRERFYAGNEAGWGAQVMEQPQAGIVVFADVDLSPEEISGDFAHQGLAPRDDLGTVGMWCSLHGESVLQAGMHHLECQFDFDAATSQLREAGVESMAPFTDFTFLRQAFTTGEIWEVDPQRLETTLASGALTAEEAEQFRKQGAVGSHMEILERNDGYKGFNQTGVSDIIARTDPRKISTN